jgi:hypothetical protein
VAQRALGQAAAPLMPQLVQQPLPWVLEKEVQSAERSHELAFLLAWWPSLSKFLQPSISHSLGRWSLLALVSTEAEILAVLLCAPAAEEQEVQEEEQQEEEEEQQEEEQQPPL